MPSKLFHSTASWDTYSVRNLLDAIAQNQITHIVSVELFSFLSREACLLSNLHKEIHLVPIIWENVPNHPFYHLPFYRRNFLSTLTKLHRIICATEKSRRHLASLRIDEEKTSVVHPGILVEDMAWNYSFEDRPLDILFVGTLNGHKGAHLLMPLAEALISRRPGLRIGIVGDGPFKEEMVRLKKKHYPNVEYFGNVPHNKINRIYLASKILISPCLPVKKLGILLQEEQFGFSVVEAMGAGLTIVSTEVGALPEVIGETNFIVRPEINDFVNVLDSILDDSHFLKCNAERNVGRVNELFNAKKQSAIFFKELDS